MKEKIELYIDPKQAVTLVNEGWEGLRPDLIKYAQTAADEFVSRLKRRLFRLGTGRIRRRGRQVQRASAPGQAPAYRSGDYYKSFATDTRSLKKQVQGRIGSPLWYIGRVLEYGNRWIRPRPHVRPTFEEWKNALNRHIGTKAGLMLRLQTVLETQLAILAADAELLALLGGPFIDARNSVEVIEQIPGVYWSLPVVEAMTETTEPATVQWDIWAHTLAATYAIEARLRVLLHRELSEDWGGVRATSQFTGSTDWPAGKRVGIYRRIMETELNVTRQRAA